MRGSVHHIETVLRRRGVLIAFVGGIGLLATMPSRGVAQNLTVDNQTITLGGVHKYDEVRVINGGKIVVPKYLGTNKTSNGNLQIVANSIFVDATSSIVADSAGFQPKRCDNGPGPTTSGGGRGGCAVLDSGGGGAHYGRGGRGTKDCFCVAPNGSCQFPAEFEEACGQINPNNPNQCQSLGGAPSGTCPAISGTCYNNDGLPSVAGVAYPHSVYGVEFGAAGGDKGCRDGWDTCVVAGAGGGRIVLAAVNASSTGSIEIRGKVTANGQRGCGHGNDSGGGGAGGAILIVGDNVKVTQTASVSAAGGLGGDTQGLNLAACFDPNCAQQGGVCDDCGGGGGGGIISVLSGSPAVLESKAAFNVEGAEGGTCTICKGEAGGGAGELQLNGKYTGEFCDGYDNDFDGLVDEELGSVSCGTGSCQVTVDQCNTLNPANVFPNDCIPNSIPTCMPPLTDSRSRFMVILDTSATMLMTLGGMPTFGDGSSGHEGLDVDGDGKPNDSRLYKAKNALNNVISAYPEIDFGLARFAQGTDTNVNCQLAHWFECSGTWPNESLCCTYDNPTNNSGGTPPTGACSLTVGAAGTITVQPTSPGDECINYAGWCGPPRRGADVVVGFEKPIGQKLMWLDHQETAFLNGRTEGDHCDYTLGGDCEFRGTGPTPLAGSLETVLAYLAGVKAEDEVASCRKYSVILLTDGSETCFGDPVAAAAELLQLNVETFVIGFSVLSTEKAQLTAIAKAGSPSGTRDAFFANNEVELASALASIVADSVKFESCNGFDDDCDTLCDEDWPQVAVTHASCSNPRSAQTCTVGTGICKRTGVYQCRADGTGVQCSVMAGPPNSGGEVCGNALDDNCDGRVDENCGGTVCQPEVCDGKDNDCDGAIDEDYVSIACGSAIGTCVPGKTACELGKVVCNGAKGPVAEICDNKDNNCDTIVDEIVEVCFTGATGCSISTGSCVGRCRLGNRVCKNGSFPPGCSGEVVPTTEVCNGIDDDCDGETDEGVAQLCTNYNDCSTFATCAACPNAPDEICDGKDNNCNGAIDDDPLLVGTSCGGTDLCSAGTWSCTDGKLVCSGAQSPGTPEICDGLDNDCNGLIDDNIVGVGTTCGTDQGECQSGKIACTPGGLSCVGAIDEKEEICDGKDNDCDGESDESAECPGESQCIGGMCVAPCSGGEFACPSKTRCENGFCIPDQCFGVACTETQRCQEGVCIEKCSTANCLDHQRCDAKTGTCVDDSCISKGCALGKVCLGFECVEDPCQASPCGPNQLCAEGNCFDTCLNVTCDEGKHCIRGECVVSLCEGVSCQANHVCEEQGDKPVCVPDPCRLKKCAANEVCREGDCVADPCTTTVCPTGMRCKVTAQGKSDCEPIPGQALPQTQRILATGAGGWSCAVSSSTSEAALSEMLLLMMLLTLHLFTRRRAS